MIPVGWEGVVSLLRGGEKVPTEGAFTPSDAYMKDGAEVADAQLVKGGVRLAQFLNDTFK